MRLNEYTESRFALGSDVLIGIVSELPRQNIEALYKRLWLEVFQFERRFSRFLPQSELTDFNQSAGIKKYVTPEFMELLQAAKKYGLLTNGLFNPFILPALQRAGYSNSAAAGYEADDQIDYSFKNVVKVNKLIIGESWATIPYGTALDFGGCGKGFLADKLGELLMQHRVSGFWLSLGGDILTYGHDKDGHPITIAVQKASNLLKESGYIIKTTGELCGIATSGTFKRTNQSSSGSWHHIIDPITLKPVESTIKLATVCANSAIAADVLASCAVLLGVKDAMSTLNKLGADSMLLQYQHSNGDIRTKSYGSLVQQLHAETSPLKVAQHA